MAGQHTPAPWGYTLGQVMRVTTPDGKAVCGVHRIGSHTGDGDPAVWAANARLIAAAPDLRNGCNALLGLLTLLAARNDISDEVRECLTHGHRIDEARAAIAKAEGQP